MHSRKKTRWRCALRTSRNSLTQTLIAVMPLKNGIQ
jgi:hypothetical protein